MEVNMIDNKSTFEKDYAHLRNAAIISIIPPLKWFIKFCILTGIVLAFRIGFSTECPRTASIYPPDLNGCVHQWSHGVIICQHSNWQPLFDIVWDIYHLFVWVIGYAYFGICF
jgi:hypothetical protein